VWGGAAFGVVVAQLMGPAGGVTDALRLTLFGFAGALIAGLIVYLIAATGASLPVQTLVLAGVIVGLFFAAAITVVTSLVDINRLGGIVHWLLGNVSAIPPRGLAVFAMLGTVGFWLIAGQARQLNVLALGEEAALRSGATAGRRTPGVSGAAALPPACVAPFGGRMGFVGLFVPHSARMVVGPAPRLLVPAPLLGGAIFLLVADTLARNVVAPAELSVGVLTSLCGAPFFIYLLKTRYRAGL